MGSDCVNANCKNITIRVGPSAPCSENTLKGWPLCLGQHFLAPYIYNKLQTAAKAALL